MGSSDTKIDVGGAGLTAPVLPGERHEIIDIIRGFALFGVLLANMVWTMIWVAHEKWDESEPIGFLLDEYLMATFVDYKFYTLFSMLFGVGFAMQLSRAAAKGGSIVPMYIRRLTVLFVIGVLHAIFIWFGDVLHIYALLGLVLILMRNRSDRFILIAAVMIAIITWALPTMQWALTTVGIEFPDRLAGFPPPYERLVMFQSGSAAEIVAFNFSWQLHDYTSLEPSGVFQFYMNVLWKFLLGFYIGRRLLLQRAAQHLSLFRRVLPFALIIGVLGNSALGLSWYLFGEWPLAPNSAASLLSIPIEFCIFALSMAYLCILVLLYYSKHMRWLVAPLAPVGRMALTNYLTHSVLFWIIFYGVGFGLIGKVSIYDCLGISAAIFAVQMVFSAIWLKHFRFGPMEWLWRCLTYGRIQPFRKIRQA